MSDNLRGIVLKLLSTLFFTTMGAVVSHLAARIPTGEIVFFRTFFALIPLYIWFWFMGDVKTVHKTSNFKGHFIRSLNSFAGMFLGFLTLAYLPLTDQVAICYAAPLITIPLAVLMLKEVVRIYRWSAVIIGLIGVLIILYPYLGQGGMGREATTGAMVGLLAAFSYALGAVIVRQLMSKETMSATVFYFCVLTGAFSLVTLPFGWVMPSLTEFLLLLLVGILGGLGQMLITQAFKYADTTLVAPFEYTSIIWASLIGYYISGLWPTSYTIVGSIIVICSGLFVIWREKQLGLKNKADIL